jgi:hypothetical protein
MKITDVKKQAVPIAIYVAVVGWPLAVFAYPTLPPYAVSFGTCVVYSFAIWPTYWLDQWIFGGVGLGSRLGFAVLALLLILLLWPILVDFTTRERQSPLWRKAFGVYRIVLVAWAVAATCLMLMAGQRLFE